MAPKNPGLKPINLIAGANTPPPVNPPATPPGAGLSKVPPPIAPKTFTPVVSNYGKASAARPLAQQSGKSSSGDGFQITDIIGPKRALTELKSVVQLAGYAIPGLVTLAGGLGADIYHHAVLKDVGDGYDPNTTKELVKGFATTFTPGHYVDLWHKLQNGEALTPFLVQDAGNIAIIGSVLTKGITAGAISATAKAETAARAAAGRGTAEAIAEAAARATKMSERATKLTKVGEQSRAVSRNLNKPMEWSFKPYMWAAKEMHSVYKTGAIPYFYDFKEGVPVTWETNLWGQTAAARYADEIVNYRASNPEATLLDGNLQDLVNKFNRHSGIGRGSLKAAVIRRAARDAVFDGSQTFRALINEKLNPAYAKEINPETGEVWGELSAVEEQALLATMNGRGQLIKAMSEATGLSPSELAILGRVDWMPEYHLSPAGAEMAVKFINGDGSLSAMQYDRLNNAIEGVGKSIENVTNKSLAGYGRKTKMPLDYTVPTPHVKQLAEAIQKSKNKDLMDMFKLAERSGIWDLPLNNPLRRNLIMRMVELLPDEIALDPSLYPAIERENLAFFNRVRKAIDNGEVGKILGEPMPEGPFGPDDYTIAPNKGRNSKAQAMIDAGRQKVRKIENTILKIATQIDKTEAAHSQKVDLVRRNDMVDAYIAGTSPKSLARKYRMPLSEVEKVLAKHPVSKAWREVLKTQEAMASLERVIGKKRAAMSEGELALEADSMRNQLETRRQEIEVAKNQYETMVQVNETLRQTIESGIDLDAQQHERLYDDLYNAELELEIAGGNVEDIQIPLDEIPDNAPMTLGRAGAHVTELTRRIDEVFSKEAEAVSPELAADVQRVKVVMNSAWQLAENAFYDSPTEQLTVIAQARIEQLGRLYESLVKGATDANSLVDQTLRNKAALDIASGVTSPFARAAGDMKPLFPKGEEIDFRKSENGNLNYDSEQVVSLNPNNDFAAELLGLAEVVKETIKAPEITKGPRGRTYSPDVVVNYNNLGYPVARITFTYENGVVNDVNLIFRTTSRNIKFDLSATFDDVPTATVTIKEFVDVFDVLVSEWESYKLDPENNLPPNTEFYSDQYFPDANFENSSYSEPIEITFDHPTFTGKRFGFEQDAARFDADLALAKNFIDELVGPRGVVDPSQALLSPPKVIDGEVIQPLRAPDVVGAVELTPELEGYAKTAAEDPQLLEDLRMERDDALALERDIERVKNPTPEDIKTYREQQIKFYNDELYTLHGYAQSNLGAGVDVKTGAPKWNLSPKKEQAEWDWWFEGLDGKQRQAIARDFFRTTEFKNPTFSGPRYLREGQGVDDYATQANMTIGEFTDAMLENINNIYKARREIRNIKATEDAVLGDQFSKINLDELTSYQEKMSMSGSEYEAVVARAENLAGSKPNPIDVENLRPVANTPDEVVPDIAITSEAVRNAAYEADVIDAMAKEATKKMKSAERLSDRLQALDEFIVQSEKYRTQSKTLIERQNATKKTRLQQTKREEKLRNLREKQRVAINQSRRLTKVLDEFQASPGLINFKALDSALPLRTALEPGYPSEQFPVEFINEEGVAESFDLSGPMYLPSGLGEPYVGGLSKTTAREGLAGYNKSTNEHYRQGDRHTIFSIRQIADRLARDMSNMTLNDKFRQVISTFGRKVSEVLDEELILNLRTKAERKATATPYEILDEARSAGLLDEDGLQAYSAGFENPQKVYELALAIEFGKLVNLEMNIRGFDAVDPYSPLETRIGISRINEEAMFVENGIKEAISKQVQVFDPTRFDVAWRAMGKVTQLFKVSTLALSATWQLGDIISTFVIAGMVGVKPLDLIARMKQVKADEYGPGLRNLFDPNAVLPPVEGYTTIAVESPTQDVGLSQDETLIRQGRTAATEKTTRLNRISKGRLDYPEITKGRNPAKLNFKLNETINRISRHAFFLELFEAKLAEKGLTIDTVFNDKSWRNNPEIHDLVFEVADSANKWLGDFSDLSMAERKYITAIYPFYAWMKHIHKVFYAIGTEHPQSLAWHIYIGSLNFDPNEDPMGLRSGTVGMFGGLASMNFLNPFGDIAEGPSSYFLTGDRSKITRGMGPVPRLALGLGAGFDIANFQDVQRPAESYSKNRIGKNIAPFTNVSDVLGFTANQFPIVKRGLQALPEGKIPLTNIATGSLSTYPTGQARLNPYTQEPIGKWGGQAAAIGRLFSLPGIPYQTDKQIKQVEEAARKRLRQIQTQQGG